MYIQEIKQAYVFHFSSCLVYVPYDGRLTPSKMKNICESAKKYCAHMGIMGASCGWKAKSVKIFREEGSETSMYREDGASGRSTVYVCAYDYAKYQ